MAWLMEVDRLCSGAISGTTDDQGRHWKGWRAADSSLCHLERGFSLQYNNLHQATLFCLRSTAIVFRQILQQHADYVSAAFQQSSSTSTQPFKHTYHAVSLPTPLLPQTTVPRRRFLWQEPLSMTLTASTNPTRRLTPEQ